MIDFWIDRLDDPFERFALQQVLGSRYRRGIA